MKQLFITLLLFLNIHAQTIDDIVDNFSTYDTQTVTITGTILNDFGSLQTTRTNVYIVAASGKALNVSSATLYSNLERGMNVTMTGTISSYRDIYQIEPTSAPTVNSSGNSIPSPISVATSTIAGITYHGAYVLVSGNVTDKFNTGGSDWNITIDDGSGGAVVRVWGSTGIDVSAITVGAAWSAQGGMGAFNEGQILPSEQSDLFQGTPGVYGFTAQPSASTTSSSATIGFSTSDASTAVIQYGATSSYGNTKTVSTSATSFSEVLSGLSESTLYHFKVDITNASNTSETETTGDLTFTTLGSGGQTDISNIVDNFSTYDGQTVTIEGILLNDFGNIRTDRTSVFISSSTGKVLDLSSSTLYSNLRRGMRVSVTGTISEFGNTYQISPDGAPNVIASDQPIPDPILAKTGDVNNLDHKNQYVSVSGNVVDAYTTGSSGANIEIDDGTGFTTVRLWATTGLTINNITIGELYTMRGITGEFSGSGQIIPSVSDDIIEGIVGGDDLFGNKAIALEVEAQVYNVSSNESIDINYKAPAGSQVRLTIYDMMGRKVKSFISKNGLGFSSGVRWNKITDDFQRVRIGTYIIYMEVMESNGKKSAKKAPIVIGSRL